MLTKWHKVCTLHCKSKGGETRFGKIPAFLTAIAEKKIKFEPFACYNSHTWPKEREREKKTKLNHNINNKTSNEMKQKKIKTLEKTFNHQLSNNYLGEEIFSSTKWEHDAFHARNKTINTFDRRTLKTEAMKRKSQW